MYLTSEVSKQVLFRIVIFILPCRIRLLGVRAMGKLTGKILILGKKGNPEWVPDIF